MKFINIKRYIRSNRACQEQQIFSGVLDPIKQGRIRGMMAYRGPQGYIYNDVMRFPELQTDVSKEVYKNIELTKQARLDSPYDNHEYVFRRINLEQMRQMKGNKFTDEFINSHQKGKIIKDNAFVSSSYDYNAYTYPKGTEEMLYRINHYSGRDISGIPGIEAEKEILLQPGFEGLVRNSGVYGNIHWVELDEIIRLQKIKRGF